MTRCVLGHGGPWFDWCPYCPKGAERRARFFADAARAMRQWMRR